MKILVTSTPGTGHIHPLAPLAMALQNAGHELLWAVSEQSCARLSDYGFAVHPAGMSVGDRVASLAPSMAEITQLEPRSRRGRLFCGYFALAAAPRMRADLETLFESFDPDIVVHEMAELAAAPMAVARGLPHVTVAFGGILPAETLAMLTDAIAPVWIAEELSEPNLADIVGDLYLHPFPPSFGQQPDLPALQLLRPQTFVADPDATPPVWMEDFATTRPGLYMTFGTEASARQAPWQAAFEAISGLDVDCIATIGEYLDIDDLGPVPPNVSIAPYVPHHLILDRASIVMSHGGAGTLLAAAAHGLPQLAIPLAADQWQNADALTSSGAGSTAEPDHRTAGDIMSQLRSLLDDVGYRDAAAAVAEEIRAMPAPEEYVSVLEALAEG